MNGIRPLRVRMEGKTKSRRGRKLIRREIYPQSLLMLLLEGESLEVVE
jgi:hypothetical protein